MRKFLYIMPAALICMVYTILTVLVGSISGYQPIVLVYIGFPILAAVFLRKGKWWGCLFGMAMGAVLLYMGSRYSGQVLDIEKPLGTVFLIYYAVMGILCRKRNCRAGS